MSESTIEREEAAATVPAPAPEKKIARSLALTDQGAFALKTMDDQMAFAGRLIADKLVSSTFTTTAQVIIGIQYAKSMQMEPILALRRMYVVNGVPCLYSEGPLALCQRSAHWGKIREYYLAQDMREICPQNKNLDAEAFAAVTEVWRNGDEHPQIDFFTVTDMEKAGLNQTASGKPKDVWVKWQRLMLRYKARSMALKSKFADCLMGIAIAEHEFNYTPEMPDVRVVRSSKAADELNREYLGEAKEETGQASLGPGAG